MDVEEYINSCIAGGLEPKGSEEWDIGSIGDFTQESLNSYGYCIIAGGRVYAIFNPSPVHGLCTSVFQQNLIDRVGPSSRESKCFIYPATGVCTVIKNHFNCKKVQQKKPDGGLFQKDTSAADFHYLVLFEVAFWHEPFGQLVAEYFNYLQSTNNVQYAVGIYINPEAAMFEMRVFLLRRVDNFDPSLQDSMLKAIDEEYILRKNAALCKGFKTFAKALEKKNFSNFV